MRSESSPHSDMITAAQHVAELGVWTWNLTTDAVQWCEILYRVIGAPPTTPPNWATLRACVHPDDVTLVDSAVEGTRRAGVPYRLDHRIVRADGETRVVDARGTVVERSSGERSLVGTMQDVTDVRAVITRNVIAERSAAIATLAAGVAHEINNPLAPISANLEMIAIELHQLRVVDGEGLPLAGSAAESRRGSIDAEITAMLGEIREGVDRIHKVVRGLTTFARTNPRGRAALDVRRVMDLAIDLAGSEVRTRSALVKDYRATPAVIANEAQLAQVFVNLLLNAVHAIGGRAADEHEIRIVTKTDDGAHAVIEVHDTGRGIPVADQGRIFEPFFTTKAVGDGTGLGLSICHGIVSSLGGTIGVHSAPGAGSTFRVALPAAQPAAARLERSGRPTALGTKRGRVLIVDDETITGNSLRRLLSREHVVAVASSGTQGLALLQAGERFDIILCDLMMPTMTGVELHAEIMKLAPEQADRMVFMTGGAYSPQSQAFLDKIPHRWLEKPCDIPQLREIVRAHVR